MHGTDGCSVAGCTGIKTIGLLRFALAAIWTNFDTETVAECDKIEHAMQIADHALEITKHLARGKDLTLDGVGLESWKGFLAKHGVTATT